MESLHNETTHANYQFNEEPDNRRRAGGETKRRHDVTFPLLTLHRGNDRVRFSTGFFQKENIVYNGVLHDGVSFDKIQPKQVGYFGT
jgi:hypothetical protein